MKAIDSFQKSYERHFATHPKESTDTIFFLKIYIYINKPRAYIGHFCAGIDCRHISKSGYVLFGGNVVRGVHGLCVS